MIYAPRKKFLFIHIYKTGGNSIRRILEPYDQDFGYLDSLKRLFTPNPVVTGSTFPKHASALRAKEILGSRFDPLYKFAFVRNPWDWQVSLYRYILAHPENPDHKTVNSLKDFAAYLDWRVHESLRLQSYFICDRQGELLVDFVGKFERLQEDFNKICTKIGLPGTQLPYLNKGRSDDYRSYYNESTRKLLKAAYQEDISRFGYEF